MKRLPTEYGLKIKMELLLNGKTQEWLVAEIKNRSPSTYIDSSNLSKILVGEIKESKIILIINQILSDLKSHQAPDNHESA